MLTRADIRLGVGINAHTLSVVIPGSSDFSIVEPETITLTLPAATLSTRLDTPVLGAIVINATAGNASLVGGLATYNAESYVRNASASQYVDVVLVDDYWTEETLLDGDRFAPDAVPLLLAGSHEPHGWNAIVLPVPTQRLEPRGTPPSMLPTQQLEPRGTPPSMLPTQQLEPSTQRPDADRSNPARSALMLTDRTSDKRPDADRSNPVRSGLMLTARTRDKRPDADRPNPGHTP
jgi:hypothetical protein